VQSFELPGPRGRKRLNRSLLSFNLIALASLGSFEGTELQWLGTFRRTCCGAYGRSPTNTAAMTVVRGYLQAEPALLECNLVVAHAEDPISRPKKGSQREFHFDYAGWDSLNLFIYLTDVAPDSGAHQVVVGTHRTRMGWDAIRVSVPDHEISDRFQNRILTISGPAGTMFFEDTSAFHRRQLHIRRRVMLNILWASHRSWLSKGRLVAKYANYIRVTHPTTNQ